MIKGISFLRSAGNRAVYDRLASFFSALGFAPGKGWDEDNSHGASFLAPLGNLEFVDGQSRLFTVEPEPGFAFSFWAWTDPVKGKPVAVEGDLSAAGMKFAVVVARWNAVVTERLLEGALDALLRSGAKRADIEVIRVPGAWEIPSAARSVANAGRVDAIVALGCLLRGETAHYEAIYNEVARGLGQSQQETGIPHSFGVLTCETLEQALNRAGIKAGNKGFEAATAAIEMVSLGRKLQTGVPR
jgi:6,7-dimethyl-8-ribityllumazine synthase